MATLQLNLSEKLKAAAEAQAVAAGCPSIDDYIASLIEADELPALTSEIEAQLIEGLNSGPSIPITQDFINGIKRKARQRHDSI